MKRRSITLHPAFQSLRDQLLAAGVPETQAHDNALLWQARAEAGVAAWNLENPNETLTVDDWVQRYPVTVVREQSDPARAQTLSLPLHEGRYAQAAPIDARAWYERLAGEAKARPAEEETPAEKGKDQGAPRPALVRFAHTPAMNAADERFSRHSLQRALDLGPDSPDLLVYVTPEWFLRLSGAAEPARVRAACEVVERDERLRDLPYLELSFEGDVARVINHEGAHRVAALQSLGDELVPVVLYARGLSWGREALRASGGQLQAWPRRLVSREGESVEFPVSRHAWLQSPAARTVSRQLRERMFWDLFGASKVVDDDGHPLRVFRGEHGALDGVQQYQNQVAGLTFASPAAANVYAQDPNDHSMKVEAARVMPAYLRIENPIINTPDDSFVEMGDLVEKLGLAEAIRIGIKFAESIEDTGNWQERFAGDFDSVEAFLQAHPDRVSDLYFSAYHLLDDAEEMARFVAAGFDGAIHMGNAITFGEVEYRVFDPSQVISAIEFAPEGATPVVLNRLEVDPDLDTLEMGESLLWQAQVLPAESDPLARFRAWFDGSLMRDEHGSPLPLYQLADVASEFGFAFTTTPAADASATGAPAYLKVTNPYLSEAVLTGENPAELDQVIAHAKARGHDGVVCLRGTHGREEGVCVVFEPEQIKAAIPGDDGLELPSVLAQFAGRRALTADESALMRAVDLLESGALPDIVRQETGWFLGHDQQWRFEIDDSMAELVQWGKPSVDALRQANGGEWITQDLFSERYPEHPLTAQAAFWERLHEGEWLGQSVRVGKVRLGDVLRHDRLYQAYPWVAEVHILLDDSLPVGEARYRQDAFGYLRGIALGPVADAGKALRIISHEVQHAIQEYEDFARGGLTEREGVEVAAREGKVSRGSAQDIQAVRAELAQVNQAFSEKNRQKRYKGQAAELRQLSAQAVALEQRLEALLTPTISRADAYDAYRRLAGEVEARNVEKRLTFSEEIRRETPPQVTEDVPAAQVAVLERTPLAGQVHGREENAGAVFDFGAEGGKWRTAKVGDTQVVYGLNDSGTEIEIASLRTPQAKRGKGSARRAMEALLAQADARGLAVSLGASPLDRRTRGSKLQAFYRSLGFEYTGRAYNMAGEPEMRRPARASAPEVVRVYHGTDRPVEVFDTAPVNEPERKRLGAYFSASAKFASQYGATVITADLTLHKPFDITGLSAAGAIERLPVSDRLKAELRMAFRGFDYSQYGLLEAAQREGLREALEAAGYDGVKYAEGHADAYIAFSPEQIVQVSAPALEPAEAPRDARLAEWFGASQIVDEKGHPRVVYHGTRQGGFEAFRPNRRRGEQLGFGVHFAESEQFARLYAEDDRVARKGKRPEVYAVHLRMEAPLRANTLVREGSPEFDLGLKLGGKKVYVSKDEDGVRCLYLQHAIDATSAARAEKLIREAGYDGVIYNARVGTYGVVNQTLAQAESYIVFEPGQIKSATANDGSFDRDDDSILSQTVALSGAPSLDVDNPGGEWLAEEQQANAAMGLNRYGAPYRFGRQTAHWTQRMLVPVEVLNGLKGLTGEQQNVRADALDSLLAYMGKNRRLPPEPFGLTEEHAAPYVEVWQDGSAWISEGNHRIMAAAQLGAQFLPVDIRYFAGAEAADGPLAPARVQAYDAQARALGVTPAFYFAAPPERLVEPLRGAERALQLRAWMRDSKIVDADGKPLILFHGTGRVFDHFERNQIGSMADRDRPATDSFWLAENPATADLFARLAGDGERHEAGYQMPVYVRMENPLVVDCKDWAHRYGSASAAFQLDDGQVVYDIAYFKEAAEAQARLDGCDGVIFEGGYDGTPALGRIFAVFEGHQIKSALGNDGSFDRDDPSILSQAAEVAAPAFVQIDRDSARELVEAGADPQQVRSDTGWFLGANGEWLCENGAGESVIAAVPDVRIVEGVRGAHHGQLDISLTVMLNGEAVGWLDYAVLDGQPWISMIRVAAHAQRQGYATRLLQELQRQHPGREIQWGLLTEPGAKLMASLPMVEVDTEYKPLFEKLAGLKAERDRHLAAAEQFRVQAVPDDALRARYSQALEALNRLHDDISSLEFALADEKPTIRLVRTDAPDALLRLSQFAGQKAQTADLERLALARAAVAEGMDPERVRQETGWHQGLDGHWRFELDDSGAFLLSELFEHQRQAARRLDQAEAEHAQLIADLDRYMASGEMDAGVARMLLAEGEAALSTLRADVEPLLALETYAAPLKPGETLALRDVLHHPALFRAYPELGALPVNGVTQAEAGTLAGWFDGKAIHLQVVGVSSAMVLEALQHEIQHTIQEIELFAPGGASHYFKDLSLVDQMTRPINERLHALLESDPAFGALKRQQHRLFAVLIGAYGDEVDGVRSLDWDKVPDEQAQAYGALVDQLQVFDQYWEYVDLEDQRSRIEREQPALTAHEQYRRLVGEVEARNTEARLRLDANARRLTSPQTTEDVPAQQQIMAPPGRRPRVAAASTYYPAFPPLAPVQQRLPLGWPQDPTKGTERLAFKDWFGASKAVDKSGRPLVLFHGTRGDFDAFEPGAHRGLVPEGAVFASDSPAVASGYAGQREDMTGRLVQQEGGNVMPVYMSLQNPLVVNAKGANWNDIVWQGDVWTTNDLVAHARLKGHDGVVIRNVRDVAVGLAAPANNYIAFRSEQIKSAIGNDGSFDRDDPSVLSQSPARAPARSRARPPVMRLKAPSLDDPAFAAWFAGSQVLDAEGRPLILVHGTTADFEAFGETTDIGYHFGTWQQASHIVRNKEDARLLPVSLCIRNPVRFESDPQVWAVSFVIQHLYRLGYITDRERDDLTVIAERDLAEAREVLEATGKKPYSRGWEAEWKVIWTRYNAGSLAAVRELLEAKGYDGIVYPNEFEARRYRQADSWVAFRPEQVKSVLANDGSFDRDDPSMLSQVSAPALIKTRIVDDEKVLSQFAGARAQTASHARLDEAIAAIAAGEDAEAVRQQTGWALGVDGLWRFEIDDSQAVLSPVYGELVARSRTAATLGELLEHPALFEAYPELQEAQVELANLGWNDAAVMPDGRILLNVADVTTEAADSILSALSHEIQHRIQELEGFALGGSARDMTLPSNEVLLQAVNAEYAARKTAIKKSETYQAFVQDELARIPQEERFQMVRGTLRDLGLDLAESAAWDRFLEPVEQERLDRLDELFAHVGLGFGSSGRNTLAYRLLAGEAEARNTQARLAMSASERLATPAAATLDVPGDMLIVRQGAALEAASSAFRPTLDADGQPLVVYHGSTETETVPGGRVAGDARITDAARAGLQALADQHGIADWSSVPNILERWERYGQAEGRGVTPEVIRQARAWMDAFNAHVGHDLPSVERLAFDRFRMPEGDTELGVHLGDQAAASMYGTPFAMHIALHNPIRLPDLGNWKPDAVITALRRAGVRVSVAEAQVVLTASDQNAELRALIQAKGFDGVTYRNEAEGFADSYIVLDPDQIRPVDPASMAPAPAAMSMTLPAAEMPPVPASALRDADGQPIVFYHGSPIDDIEELEHGSTAYGIFFTPDRATADYYATGSTPRVYEAYLLIENLADLDEPGVFEVIAREAVHFTEVRDDTDALRFGERLYNEGYGKNPAVTAFFDGIEGAEEIGDGYSAYDLLVDDRQDAGDIEDLVEEIGLPHVTAAFNEACPLYSPELQAVREAYGTQDFYLNHQDDFMRAAQGLGYDGVAFTDPSSTGQPISYVVFSASQVHLIEPVAEAEQVLSQAVLDEPVQDEPALASESVPGLLALHNLSENNLRFADQMGGLAAPSIAVITERQGELAGFGEITLIGTQALGDPQQVLVFDADAYTLRFPEPQYGKPKAAEVNRLCREVWAIADEFGDGSLDYETQSAADQKDLQRILRRWEQSEAIKAYFLREQGFEVAPVMREKRLPGFVAREHLPALFPLMDAIDRAQSVAQQMESPAFGPLAEAFEQAVRASNPDLFDGSETPDLVESLCTLDRGAYTTLWQAARLVREGRLVELDRVATREQLRAVMAENGLEHAFSDWLSARWAPAFGQPFLKVGRRRLEYTLENISEAMTSGQVHGQETTLVFGAGNARAYAAHRFESTEEMQAFAARNLRSAAEVDEARDLGEEHLRAFRNAVGDFHTSTNYRGEVDVWEANSDAMRALGRLAKAKNQSAASLRAALRACNFAVNAIPADVFELGLKAFDELMHTPVAYFEAKPQRAVRLEEFVGAVIPDNASATVREILARRGIAVREYPSADPGGRHAVVLAHARELAKGRPEVLFGQPLPISGQQRAEALQAWMGQSVLRTETGEPLVLYHGTNYADEQGDALTVFKRGSGTLGVGVYLDRRPEGAAFYPRMQNIRAEREGRPAGPISVMPVYAAVENPLVLEELPVSRIDTAKLAAQGFDAVFYKNEVLVFDPVQVKSAIGNDGTFDRDDPSILSQQVVETETPESRLSRYETWLQEQAREGLPVVHPVERAASFDRWFGASQVITEDGQPRVMYHATRVWEAEDGRALGDILVFDRMAAVKNLGRRPGLDTVGSWFSDRPDEQGAGMYGRDGAIYPVHLAIEKPYVVTFAELTAKALELTGQGEGRVETAEPLRDWLAEQGYDGIRILPAGDGTDGGEFDRQDVWVALHPWQIKSAIGHAGLYDRSSDSILSQRVAQAGTLESRRQANFERWFGDSRIVDEHGRPLVLHHATSADFNVFEKTADIGFHFGTQQQALHRARAVGADKVLQVYLAISNPVEMPDLGDWKPWSFTEDGLRNAYVERPDGSYAKAFSAKAIEDAAAYIEEEPDSQKAYAYLRRLLEDHGYDGIKYQNVGETEDYEAGDYSYIALHPSQIKSIDNDGSFDWADESILSQSAQADLFAGDFASKRSATRQKVWISSRDTKLVRRGNVNAAGGKIVGSRQAMENFWDWFADSAAVDAKGRPLVMYHSTNADFEAFKTGMPGTNSYGVLGNFSVTRAGIFMSPDRKFSQDYLGEGEGQRVMPVYLSIQQPLDLREGISWWLEDDLKQAGVNIERLHLASNWWSLFDNDESGESAFVDALKKLGYDGAIFEEDRPNDEEGTGLTYVAFEPSQIKSALGNRGTFDLESDSILSQSAALPPSVRRQANLLRWLGDNPLRDDAGEPLVLYHGSRQADRLDRFIPGGPMGSEQTGDAYGVASYFTSSPREASAYGTDGAVLPVYVRGRLLDTGLQALPADEVERLSAFANAMLLPADRARFPMGRAERRFGEGQIEEARSFFEVCRRQWKLRGDGMDRARPEADKEGGEFVVHYTDFDAPMTIRSGRDAALLFGAIGWDNIPAAGYDGVVLPRENGQKWVVMHRPEGNVKSALGNNGDYSDWDAHILHQFGGAGARTANLAQLSEARQRLAAGESPERVRQMTGWHEGADGRWRFEIDDSTARVMPEAVGLLRQARQPACEVAAVTYRWDERGRADLLLVPESPQSVSEMVSLEGVPPAMLRSLLPDEVIARMERGEGEASCMGANWDEAHRFDASFRFDGFNAMPLDEVLDHPALFEAYPQLRAIPVKIEHGAWPAMLGASLGVQGDSYVIGLGRALLGNTESVLDALVHELQHVIQDVEGFARGAARSPEAAEAAARAREGELLSRRPGLAGAALQRIDEELAALARQGLSVGEAYRRSAGEVEARNVQARRAMTAKERLQTPPHDTADVAWEDTIKRMTALAGQGAQVVERAQIRFGRDLQFTIALFEHANASSFIHESGHAYLEMLRDMAERTKARDSQIRKDWETLQDWLEIEDLSSKQKIPVRAHEQFARGWEAYVMRGQAPSKSLEGVFQRFSQWMKSIYRSVRNLFVRLTPEVTEVMDRMLDAERVERVAVSEPSGPGELPASAPPSR